MTRKHFIAIAKVIHDLDLDRYGDRQFQQRKYIAASLAPILASTNPAFDRDRFIRAATEGK